jgi:succinate dehydrogenase / fumarate reductase iron-sulfur subunit
MEHKNELKEKYKERFYEGCGKSLSCHDICPAGIEVDELTARSNAVAVWNR